MGSKFDSIEDPQCTQVTTVGLKSPPSGVEAWRGRCRFKLHPRHMITVQVCENYVFQDDNEIILRQLFTYKKQGEERSSTLTCDAAVTRESFLRDFSPLSQKERENRERAAERGRDPASWLALLYIDLHPDSRRGGKKCGLVTSDAPFLLLPSSRTTPNRVAWWPNGKVSASGPEGSRFETRFHRRYFVDAGLLQVKSYVWGQTPPAGMVRKSGNGVTPRVSSPSSDRGIKLRGPSQNSPRVASK
ncbi:hypothetical protein AVEN_7018-1 [Araneus ventricosus]|uniref:Uncharacterized protein n=1 Tax=Araneus ventricosus TaxID=182803 RepID=A0A4Y2IDY5_ARAVE|nr:hypothetical protein AVEN_7018-1 [Araneus ventricosus]